MDSTHFVVASVTQDPPRWVRPYLRIPYTRLDCWQLCDFVLREERGVGLPDFSDDLAHTADETLWALRLKDAVSEMVDRERPLWPRVEGEPQPCDLVLSKVFDRWHLSLVVGGGWALNTDLRRGSHCIRLRDSAWEGRIEGIYRHPALA